MNNYWPKNCKLRRAVWHQTIWIIRDYYDLSEKASESMVATPQQDDGPRGSNISDPVSRIAKSREEILKELKAIDSALELIPAEYRSPVWKNIQTGERFPIYGDRTTYSKWKQRFVYLVAYNLKLI